MNLFDFGFTWDYDHVDVNHWYQDYGQLWSTVEIGSHVLTGFMLDFDLCCLDSIHCISSNRSLIV